MIFKKSFLVIMILLVVVSAIIIFDGGSSRSTDLSDLLAGPVTRDDALVSLNSRDYSRDSFIGLSRNTVVNGYVCDEDVSDRYGQNPISPVSSAGSTLCVPNDLYPGVALQLWDLDSPTPEWQDDFIGEILINQGEEGCWVVIPNHQYEIAVYYCETDITDFTCDDTDGGINYQTYGSVSTTNTGSTPWEDNCAGDILIERYCDNDNTVATIPFNCGNFGPSWTCEFGKCKDTTPEPVDPVLPGNTGSTTTTTGSEDNSGSEDDSGSTTTTTDPIYNSCSQVVCHSGKAYCEDSNGDVGVLVDDCVSKEALCEGGACQALAPGESTEDTTSPSGSTDYLLGEGSTGGALLPSQEEVDKEDSLNKWLIIGGLLVVLMVLFKYLFGARNGSRRRKPVFKLGGRR